ncbi:carboxymuconolactone decarboxylase family protein [Pseudomonadota bacterium]
MTQFTFYTQENSEGKRKALLEGIQKGYGFVPNLFSYMAEAPTTIEAYTALNELVGKTSFSPAQQQVALLAASVENSCDFCITAHRAMGKMNKSNQQTLDALHSGSEINDPSDRALATYVRKVIEQRGFMNDEDMQEFMNAGFTKQQVIETVLIVSIKTLSNYINHVTNPEPNKELLGML